MGKKGGRKTRQQQQMVKGPRRRHGFWILGAAIVMILAVAGIVAVQGDEDSATPGTILSLAEIPRISPEAVEAKINAGASITIVDARSKTEYEQSHIVGAISMPLEEITQRYQELNRDHEIMTYCT